MKQKMFQAMHRTAIQVNNRAVFPQHQVFVLLI